MSSLPRPACLQIKSTVLLMPSGSDRITSAPLQPLQSDKALEDEEIKALLVEGEQTGVLETEERDMIERVLRLADKPVRAIMTPRNEVAWVDITDSQSEIAAALKRWPRSRSAAAPVAPAAAPAARGSAATAGGWRRRRRRRAIRFSWVTRWRKHHVCPFPLYFPLPLPDAGLGAAAAAASTTGPACPLR